MTSSVTKWLHAQLKAFKRSDSDGQHWSAFYLILGNLIATATGLVFWLLLARVFSLPAAEIGIGYAIVGMGATIGVIAKGGLDTALMRSVPESTKEGAAHLLRFGAFIGGSIALVLSVSVALVVLHLGVMPDIGPLGWTLVGAMAVLLVITWLQDAHQLAEGNAKFAVHRNLVLSVTRIALPLPIIVLAWYQPVATTWILAVAVSALVALVIRRRGARRAGRTVTHTEFVRRSIRHEASSASEFLPGLLLAPIILMAAGPSTAGHFAIVWAAASLLFVLSAAIGRSALAHMARQGPSGVAAAIRKGALQIALIVAPAALIGALLSPTILGIFGQQYAAEGATTFIILCASVVFVAPSYLYLAVLRAADRTVPLMVFPVIMLIAVIALTPLLATTYGLPGAGAAWLIGNAPLGLYAAWRLWSKAKETTPGTETHWTAGGTLTNATPNTGRDTHDARPSIRRPDPILLSLPDHVLPAGREVQE